ncbi:MAG: LysM peptidoglycan-binding domain-containing protein [Planctomycetota bacterium]
MGNNTTKIVLILAVILGVGVVAKLLDRNIDNTPSGRDQVTGRGPGGQPARIQDARLPTPTTDSSRAKPIEPKPGPEDDWASVGGSTPVTFPRDRGGLPTPESTVREHGGATDSQPEPADGGTSGLSLGTDPRPSDFGEWQDSNKSNETTLGRPSPQESASADGGRSETLGAVPDRSAPESDVSRGGMADPNPVGGNRLEEGFARGGAREDLAGTAAVQHPPAALTPGYPRQHQVREGDSLWSIAKEHYGRPELYRAILAANPDLGDGEVLKVGAAISIPAPPAPTVKPDLSKPDLGKPDLGKPDLGKPAVGKPVAGSAAAADKPKATAPRSLPPGMIAYVVRDGDTLYAIARERFGDVGRVDDILRANPGLDPLSLRVGQTIQLPAK